MKNKRIICLLIALTLIISFSACRKNKESLPPKETPEISDSSNSDEKQPVSDPEDNAESNEPKEESPLVSSAPTEQPSPTPAPTPTPSPTPTPTPPPTPTPTPTPELSLSDVISSIQYDVELPNVATAVVTSDLYSSYLFIDYIEGSEAMSCDALIGSIAHSLVVLKLPEGVDAAETAAQISANANPAKWICVEAEKVIVKSSGRFVMLVMSNAVTADAIAANFDYLMSQQ